MPGKVLIFEKHLVLRELYMLELFDNGYESYLVEDVKEASEILDEHSIDLILCDLYSPIDELREIMDEKKKHNIPLIGLADINEIEEEQIRSNLNSIVTKSGDLSELLKTVQGFTEKTEKPSIPR